MTSPTTPKPSVKRCRIDPSWPLLAFSIICGGLLLGTEAPSRARGWKCSRRENTPPARPMAQRDILLVWKVRWSTVLGFFLLELDEECVSSRRDGWFSCMEGQSILSSVNFDKESIYCAVHVRAMDLSHPTNSFYVDVHMCWCVQYRSNHLCLIFKCLINCFLKIMHKSVSHADMHFLL